METLLKHAAMAWNPMLEARRRLQEGTLTVTKILVPYLAIVIGCNLVAYAAQNFFFETLFFQVGIEMPEHPLVSNDFAQKFLSSLGALVPAAAVSMLPAGVFVG